MPSKLLAAEFASSAAARTLQLWCAYPGDLGDESVAKACASVLNDDERKKASRFVFERHRHQYIAAQALARNALAHHYPLPPEAWQFCKGAHGKPAPEPACGLHFNLSTCEELVVCLVGRGIEVGVDAEPLARGETIAGLKQEIFTRAERNQLEQLHGEEKHDRAVSMWVLKEAYTKARGMGLLMPLQGFSFLFGGDEGIRLQTEPEVNDGAGSWRYCLVDHAGHRVAAMAAVSGAATGKDGGDGEGVKLEVLLAQPPLAEPKRIDFPRAEWFPRPR
jgi:4'-phosphopantetheinyl transferase